MKHYLFCLILITNSFICFSQPQQYDAVQYEQNYWNYRDRFLKRFIKIGTQKGESLPIGGYVPDCSYGNITNSLTFPGSMHPGLCLLPSSATVQNPNCAGDYYNAIDFGDDMAASLLWEYIPTLAMEYRLLRDDGKDYIPTLNELYYAMNAINRSDVNAEPFYGASQPNSNGFFLRDDVNISLSYFF